jgi:hypothetical protein
MKSLIILTVALIVSASTVVAGENCAKTCDKATASATQCEKSKSACCEKECPVAKAALRKALLTHKGGQLAKR